MSYAAQTQVSPEKSQIEIQQTLRKYGATKFGVMEDDKAAHVMFEFNRLMIQMSVAIPQKSDFAKSDAGRIRRPAALDLAFEQAIKANWRALFLAIKAKLVAIEQGISTVEKEFLAFIILPSGRSVHEEIMPRIKEAAETGKMPTMLLQLR